jgi:UDP-N-acetyl-D-glucosamine dehydrogenase
MDWTEKLISKTLDKTAVVGIVGLGYVGLPLAVAFSKNFHVVGYNINPDKVELLKQKKSYIEDVKDDEINLKMFTPTANPDDLKQCDYIFIAVPTPLRKDKSPDLSDVKTAGEEVGNILQKEQFVILKSTTYPGTTEEVLIPILEQKSGLKAIEDFGIAYSPERVDPGNIDYNMNNTPNVVGGLIPEFTEIGAMLCENISTEVVKVTDCKTAEGVKMIENIFRNVNIALVNELALIFEKMDIDIWESIDAAKTKPYGYMAFYPGPGVGGHCIPLDPYYMAYRAKHFGFIPRFIETSGEINDYMPIHTVNLANKGLNSIGKNLWGSNILILGLAYKGNISDTRESPAAAVIDELIERGAKLRVFDPKALSINTMYGEFKSPEKMDEEIKWADCIIILTDHDEFKENKDILNILGSKDKVIVDTRNTLKITNDSKHDFDNYIKL